VRKLVDPVAKGGNFMVAAGPDGDGRFHPTAVSQLKEVGEWPKVNSVRPAEGSVIQMLGTDVPLKWSLSSAGLEVEIPPGMQDESRRPCRFAWGFQIHTETV
jgi:hypothetical protein